MVRLLMGQLPQQFQNDGTQCRSVTGTNDILKLLLQWLFQKAMKEEDDSYQTKIQTEYQVISYC